MNCEFINLLPKNANKESWIKNNPCDTERKDISGLSLCKKHEDQHNRGFFQILNKYKTKTNNIELLDLKNSLTTPSSTFNKK